jgi:hypothetical protein
MNHAEGQRREGRTGAVILVLLGGNGRLKSTGRKNEGRKMKEDQPRKTRKEKTQKNDWTTDAHGFIQITEDPGISTIDPPTRPSFFCPHLFCLLVLPGSRTRKGDGN